MCISCFLNRRIGEKDLARLENKLCSAAKMEEIIEHDIEAENSMSKIQEIAQLVETGKVKQIAGAVQAALDEGCSAEDILNHGMIDAMDVVGEKFRKNEIFVPEMLIAAKAMKKGVEVLKPYLATGSAGALGKLVIATVAGDLHDIGKNLVAMMIESAGFEVIDLGVDVSTEKIIQCYHENPDMKIIALSALLTTTMPALRDTVTALNQCDFRNKVKIMVGGAPITQSFADEIGADGYSTDAASAATLAKQLVGA